ncbi:hypothetical protein AVEN_206111-1 [Araneus ventricosus]|uniref:SOCS box domain-containing protein n=1 Tax=Araneus ventricosus TaxID=182803 RepID=A0A4Y2R3Y5_ARAVE|nr:hypothetical protein AVEN_206111-1 [Araneus ventricosus]
MNSFYISEWNESRIQILAGLGSDSTKRIVGCWDNWDELSKPENLMSKLRLYRMLQIIFIFDIAICLGLSYPNCQVHASEALRLVWSSIPDYFLCLEEMTDAYGNVLSAKAITERYNFYKEAIRQTDICREPRSLSQYCRSVIRKILADKKLWLPDGIKQLKLPPRLESFLNLQRDNLHPENFQAS